MFFTNVLLLQQFSAHLKGLSRFSLLTVIGPPEDGHSFRRTLISETSEDETVELTEDDTSVTVVVVKANELWCVR